MVMMEFKSTMVIVEFNRYIVMWGSKCSNCDIRIHAGIVDTS